MICNEYDSFLKEKDKTVWMVELTHRWGGDEYSEIIYQDDNRPGLEEPKAWIRLKNSLKKATHETIITRYGLGFRDHIEWISDAFMDGIYFSFGAAADMFNPHTSNFYVLGVVEGDKVHKYWYRVPEVILFDETYDPLPELGDPRLIMSKGPFQ